MVDVNREPEVDAAPGPVAPDLARADHDRLDFGDLFSWLVDDSGAAPTSPTQDAAAAPPMAPVPAPPMAPAAPAMGDGPDPVDTLWNFLPELERIAPGADAPPTSGAPSVDVIDPPTRPAPSPERTMAIPRRPWPDPPIPAAPLPPVRHRHGRPVTLALLALGLGLAWWRLGTAWLVTLAGAVALVILVAGWLRGAWRWRPARTLHLHRLPFAISLLVLLAVAGALAGAGAKLGSAALAASRAPLTLPVLTQGSTVYGAHGEVVAVFHGDVNRQAVSLAQVAPVMVHAVIDTEDSRFWSHDGVDAYGTVRASLHDLFGGGGRQGASTLSMQLVKNTLLAEERDGMRKKVGEAVLADRLEHRLGKRGILQEYLNTVYFGEGAYGVQAAAEEYFNLPALKLSATQAALLAGLIQNPVGYDPIYHPAAALRRRADVLHLMVLHHHLSPTQAQVAGNQPVPRVGHPPPGGDNYFLAAVRQELLRDPALGPTPAARYQALFYGGLRIHTTLDPTLQADATRAVQRGLPASPLHLSAALVAIDPATGAVRAVVGGPSYSTSKFDAALASPGRPTGSTFKVFTLIAALESGYSPNTYVDGQGPCVIPDPGNTPDPWVLSNYEGEAPGWISLTEATAKSVNCAYARLSLKVGLARIARIAHAMGVRVPLAVVPSMTLGTNSIPPVQMASAYATLADDGIYHRPYLVSEVFSPLGKVLLHISDPGQRVLDQTIARTATQVLRSVIGTGGTGQAAAVPGQDVVGKTGTGANFADAWFVGYSRSLVAGVWMGSPTGEVPMRNVGGVKVAGGTYPSRIWQDFMAAALAGRAPEPLPAPAGPLPADTAPAPSTQTTTWCSPTCLNGHPGASSSSSTSSTTTSTMAAASASSTTTSTSTTAPPSSPPPTTSDSTTTSTTTGSSTTGSSTGSSTTTTTAPPPPKK